MSAALIVGTLIAILYADYYSPHLSGLWIVPLLLVLTGLAVSELRNMLSDAEKPVAWASYGGSYLVVLASCVPVFWQLGGDTYPANCPLGKNGWALAAAAFAIALCFFAEMLRYQKPGGNVIRVALNVLIVTYIGVLSSFLVALRLYNDHYWGMAALISLIFVVKLSDAGAYFSGRLLGKHKLAPRLSPGKTIQGSIGGLVTASIASGLFFYVIIDWIMPADHTITRPDWWQWIAYGLIIGVAGMVGDLAESLLKRDFGVKDSSSWLPGLGGVLDVLDSLLLSAAPAYMCWICGLVGAK